MVKKEKARVKWIDKDKKEIGLSRPRIIVITGLCEGVLSDGLPVLKTADGWVYWAR